MLEPHPPCREGGFFDALGVVGLEPAQRLVHQRRDGWDPVRPAGDRGVPVHEGDRVGAEVGGVFGDLAGPPRLQPSGLDQPPQPGQPETELDGLRHQPQTRPVGQVQCGGELLDRELGHRRGTRPPPTAAPT